MATLADLRARVRSQSRDENAAYVTDADIDAWINEAYVDLAARLELIQGEVTGTTSGSALISLPSGGASLEVLRPTSLRFEDDDVEFIDETTFYAYSDSGASPEHSIGIVFQGQVQVYPTPDSGTPYVLRYRAIPATLTSSDTVALPTHLHARLVRFAEAQVWYKLDDTARGDRALAEFEDGLPDAALGMDKLMPGPFTLAHEPTAFDLDPEARHL